MAWEYGKLLHRIVHKEDLVSVIIPTTLDRADNVVKILNSLENQTYNKMAIEAIVILDEVATEENLAKIREFPYKGILTTQLLVTNREGYNLAHARNMGALVSMGKYLLFCDSRLVPDEDSVFQFVQAIGQLENKRMWLFGEKGSRKNAFVENFSFIPRKEFFRFGMMNEMIDKYGGMSQEIRTRFSLQGGEFSYVPTALATQMMKSGSSKEKREAIIDMKFRLLQMYDGAEH